MAKNERKAMAPVVRTSAGLRDALFDELDAMRDGTSNPTRANAIAKLATSMVETVHMDIEVQRHLRQHIAANDVTQAALGAPTTLGTV